MTAPRSIIPQVLIKGAGKWFTLALTTAGAIIGLLVNARNLGLTPWLGASGISFADLAARRVTITPPAHTLEALGDTVLLAATVADEHGATLAGATLLWRSEDTTVVAVDSSGTAIARGPGAATVSVSVRELVARARIMVNQQLTGLTLGGDSLIRLRESEAVSLPARPLDRRGYPIRGMMPAWHSSDTAVAKVDSLGRVTGGSPGRAVITAVLDRYTANTVVEVVLAPAVLSVASGDGQRADAGHPLPLPVSVRVTSRAGRPVPHIPVRFALQGTRGALQPAGGTTDAAGRVHTVWTLGTTPGRQAIRIAAEGIDSVVVISAEADPVRANTRVEVLGPPPVGRVGEVLTQPVVVQLTDGSGTAMPDVPVAWTPLDGGAVELIDPRTDSLGQARARWTLGPRAGPQRLRAHAGNPRTLPAQVLAATAMAGWPAQVRLEGGDGQRGPVGQPLRRDMTFRVTDRFGNPVPDVGLMARVTGGELEDTARVTGADGRAAFRWILGRTAGRQQIEVKAPGLDSVGRGAAMALARAPANVAFQNVAESVPPGRAVPVAVTVTDDYGNAISDVQVVFTASAGSVAPARVATDARGAAGTRWNPGSRLGDAVLTASVRGTTVKASHTARVGGTASRRT